MQFKTADVGEILKRPTRADCKSADYIFAGSNPALPTKKPLKRVVFFIDYIFVIYSNINVTETVEIISISPTANVSLGKSSLSIAIVFIIPPYIGCG